MIAVLGPPAARLIRAAELGHDFLAIQTSIAAIFVLAALVTDVEGDAFLFGSETRGLPQELLETFAPEQRIRLPMLPHSRSLNLSNSAAVITYEAWRQNGFAGGK